MQYTTNYSLRKPQLGEPAKVEDVNYNSDSVDNLIYQNRRMVKEYEYDSTKQYHAGDTEIYEGVYYKCLDDTTGVWDPTKWEQTDLTAEIEIAKQPELPPTTSASVGDVVTLGNNGPEWAAPAGGGGGAFIDTSNVIQGYTKILEYATLNYTATQDCCVVFEIYPSLNGLNSIIIDNITVKAVFGALGNSGGYGVTDHVFLKAGQSLVVQYNGQNYLGHYYVYGVK